MAPISAVRLCVRAGARIASCSPPLRPWKTARRRRQSAERLQRSNRRHRIILLLGLVQSRSTSTLNNGENLHLLRRGCLASKVCRIDMGCIRVRVGCGQKIKNHSCQITLDLTFECVYHNGKTFPSSSTIERNPLPESTGKVHPDSLLFHPLIHVHLHPRTLGRRLPVSSASTVGIAAPPSQASFVAAALGGGYPVGCLRGICEAAGFLCQPGRGANLLQVQDRTLPDFGYARAPAFGVSETECFAGSFAEGADLLPRLPDDITSPPSHVDREERHSLIRRALESLSEADRCVLVLRHFDNLDNRVCAEILGISPKAAAQRHIRAQERLHARIESLSCFRTSAFPCT